MDTPHPVATAIYAAMHKGHFGRSTSTAVGTIHFVVESARRNFDGRTPNDRSEVP
jgi:hypothetical protein